MSLVKNIGIFIIVFAIFAFALSRYTPQDAKPEDVSLNVVATQIIEGTVEKIEIEQENVK